MTWIVLLAVVGLVLVLAEVILPGGIIGGIGAILMIVACVLAFFEWGSGGGLLTIAVLLLLTGLALYLEFRVLPRTKLGSRAFLTKQISGTSSPAAMEARLLIGRTAEAATRLSPTGYVRVDGRQYEAFCRSGQVPAGSQLEIVDADAFRLIVTPRTPTP